MTRGRGLCAPSCPDGQFTPAEYLTQDEKDRSALIDAVRLRQQCGAKRLCARRMSFEQPAASATGPEPACRKPIFERHAFPAMRCGPCYRHCRDRRPRNAAALTLKYQQEHCAGSVSFRRQQYTSSPPAGRFPRIPAAYSPKTPVMAQSFTGLGAWHTCEFELDPFPIDHHEKKSLFLRRAPRASMIQTSPARATADNVTRQARNSSMPRSVRMVAQCRSQWAAAGSHPRSWRRCARPIDLTCWRLARAFRRWARLRFRNAQSGSRDCYFWGRQNDWRFATGGKNSAVKKNVRDMRFST